MSVNGHADIISKLGGGKKLTIRLKNLTEENINEKTVYSWVQQGIPDKWKVAVARCLLEDNIEVDKYKDLLLIFSYLLFHISKVCHQDLRPSAVEFYSHTVKAFYMG